MTVTLDARTIIICLAVGVAWWLLCFIVDRLSGRGANRNG